MLTHFRSRAIVVLVCVLCLQFGREAAAQQWPLTQLPPSVLLAYESADTVNSQMRGNPPFWSGTTVGTVFLTESMQFVRLYNPEAGSNALGSWIMPIWEVRGLTPQQIRDKFSLPSVPTNIELVTVQAGTSMYIGTAGPIEGWGHGGGLQFKIISPFQPDSSYFNRQWLTGTALSYREAAVGGDAAIVGTYLDRLPVGQVDPWGDLYEVMSALDRLMDPVTGALVGPSLDRLTPEPYELQTVIGERQAQFFEKAVEHRLAAAADAAATRQRQPAEEQEGTSAEQPGRPTRHLWLEALGVDVTRAGDNGGEPFHGRSGALYLGLETPVAEDWTIGLAGSWGRSWADIDGGDATLTADHLSLGPYALWTHDGWQARAGLAGSLALENMQREIVFPGVAREATASPVTTAVSSHLGFGYCFALEQFRLTPDAGIAWTWQHHYGFSEDDAGALALDVQSRDAHSLRSWFNLKLEREFALGETIRMRPSLRAGWRWNGPLDDRQIQSSLIQYNETYAVHGDSSSRHGGTIEATLRLFGKEPRDWRVQAEYEGEFYQDMTSHTISADVAISF